ncbi:MAG: segregation and condensation protein A [Tepidisphaerales bacterium]
MDYRVQLDVYHGPLDLLLYLIKRDELDIHDIPIAHITDSYLEYVRDLRETARLDINVAGDFMVMAATLMEIKSAMLLPRQESADVAGGVGTGGTGGAGGDLADPRADLVRQLLEYKRFKDTARLLEHRQQRHAHRFAREPVRPGAPDEPPPLDLDEVQVWDLLAAFTRLMKEVGARGPLDHEVIDDDTPLELHAADIEDRIRRDGPVTLRTLLLGRSSRAEMIGVFLALLELVRQRKVELADADGPDVQIIPPTSQGQPPAGADDALPAQAAAVPEDVPPPAGGSAASNADA